MYSYGMMTCLRKSCGRIHLLRYCAWCGRFQGAKPGNGVQVRGNRSEIDTSTICPPCLVRETASAAGEKKGGSGAHF